MNALIYLIPVSIILGVAGLAAFLWSFKSGQYQDLDGAAQRVLFEDEDAPETLWDRTPAAGGKPTPNTTPFHRP